MDTTTLAAALAWMFLAGFVGAFVWGVVTAFGRATENDVITYFATGLSTMVVAIVAAAVHQNPPQTLTALFAGPADRSLIVDWYVWSYFVCGVISIFVWAMNVKSTPVHIKTLATGVFGLGAAIVTGFLKGSSPFFHL